MNLPGRRGSWEMRRGHGLGMGRGSRGKRACGGWKLGTSRVRIESPADHAATRNAPVADRGCRVIAVVDAENCAVCGTCVDACPERAIIMTEKLTVDPERCTGCGECVAVCPNLAMSLERQKPAAAPVAAG